jgi:5-methylcytosine-specific restriction endonuclease McrA
MPDERLERIFERTDGRCHICGGGLCFRNYGRPDARGAWEVEHSHPRCKGGTNSLNNLYAAHIRCNRQKGSYTTRTARGWHSRTRAPLSTQKKAETRIRNGLGLGLLGLLFGAATGGIGAALLFGGAGACLGHNLSLEG